MHTFAPWLASAACSAARAASAVSLARCRMRCRDAEPPSGTALLASGPIVAPSLPPAAPCVVVQPDCHVVCRAVKHAQHEALFKMAQLPAHTAQDWVSG